MVRKLWRRCNVFIHDRTGPKIIAQAAAHKYTYSGQRLPPALEEAVLDCQLPLIVLDALVTNFRDLQSNQIIQHIRGLYNKAKAELAEHHGTYLKWVNKCPHCL